MEKLIIEGGRTLKGEIQVSGAKNAVLPIMAAVLLTDEPCVIRRVPDLRDMAYFWSAVHQSMLSFDDILLNELYQKLMDFIVLFLIVSLWPLFLGNFGEQVNSVLIFDSSQELQHFLIKNKFAILALFFNQ